MSWDDDKSAENKRRIALLSESLQASEIHDLQVLRRSLERQLNDAGTPAVQSREGGSTKKVARTAMVKTPPLTVLDEDAQWHTDMLRERLGAVTRAVEKKGGWRSAMFLTGGEVDVDVDVEPWSPGDGVMMLQTVKDALVVQLEEV